MQYVSIALTRHEFQSIHGRPDDLSTQPFGALWNGAKPSKAIAEQYIGIIQGGLLLARGLNDPNVFTRTLDHLNQRLSDLIETEH